MSSSAINVEGRGLPALAGSGMPATAKLSEPVLELVLNCCSHVTPHTCWRRYPGRALEKLNVRVVVRGMLPHVKRSSIEAVVRGSAAHRLVLPRGPDGAFRR